MLKILWISTFIIALGPMAQASCTWNGFRFPENWKFEIKNHVFGHESRLSKPEGYISFGAPEELEQFVKTTVEAGLDQVAQMNPCLLNDRVKTLGLNPLIFSDEHPGLAYLEYQKSKRATFLGQKGRKAKIRLGYSHPYIRPVRLKNIILHGVLHHLGFDNRITQAHYASEVHERESYVFQDFRGFMDILGRDLVYACTQAVYPAENFLQLQGVDFIQACQTCMSGQLPDDQRSSLVMGPSTDESRQHCESLREGYLETHGFSPGPEEEALMLINEVEEFRREAEERRSRIRSGIP